jgi:hypothetical protein
MPISLFCIRRTGISAVRDRRQNEASRALIATSGCYGVPAASRPGESGRHSRVSGIITLTVPGW